VGECRQEGSIQETTAKGLAETGQGDEEEQPGKRMSVLCHCGLPLTVYYEGPSEDSPDSHNAQPMLVSVGHADRSALTKACENCFQTLPKRDLGALLLERT